MKKLFLLFALFPFGALAEDYGEYNEQAAFQQQNQEAEAYRQQVAQAEQQAAQQQQMQQMQQQVQQQQQQIDTYNNMSPVERLRGY